MTLEEAIDQLINVGEGDPLTIARKVNNAHDAAWLKDELLAHSEDLIAEIARRKLGAIRRSAEIALRPGDQHTQADLMIVKAWVPGEGWKRAADLTPTDCRKRAGFYDVISAAANRRSAWFREIADMMDADNVKTLGGLKRDLPALPADDLLELVA
jgi:hypothetical protein